MALATRADAPEAKAEYRQRSQRLYSELVAEDPSNPNALLGLALFATDAPTRQSLLRRASEAQPTNDALMELLANSLVHTEPAESARLIEQGYGVASTDARRLHLAALAVSLYERAGSPEHATRMRNRVRADFTVDSDPLGMGPDRAANFGEQICDKDMLTAVGMEPCFNALRQLIDTAKRQSAYMQSAALGMLTAARSGTVLERADPAWRNRFETSLDEFIASGTAPAEVFTALAFVTTDKQKRYRTMKDAAALFPTDGEITLGFGLASLDVRQKDDAVAALSSARRLLPTSRHAFIDRMLSETSELP
jgi:hypothetical protein